MQYSKTKWAYAIDACRNTDRKETKLALPFFGTNTLKPGFADTHTHTVAVFANKTEEKERSYCAWETIRISHTIDKIGANNKILARAFEIILSCEM